MAVPHTLHRPIRPANANGPQTTTPQRERPAAGAGRHDLQSKRSALPAVSRGNNDGRNDRGLAHCWTKSYDKPARRQSLTTIVPFSRGWSVQAYGYLPAFLNVYSNVCLRLSVPDLNEPSSALIEWS